MESNQPCPYCEAVGRLLNGHLCPCCNGFKRVGEVGLMRAKAFKAVDEKIRRGELPPPDFDNEPCYF